MKLRNAYLAATMLAVPAVASAEPVNGFYVTIGGGVQLMDTVLEQQAYSGPLTPNPGVQVTIGNVPGGAFYNNAGPTWYNTGPVILGSIGYGFSNNLRGELELSYSTNRITRLNNGLTTAGLGTDPLGLAYTGNEKKYTLMANAIYDFNTLAKDFGLPFTPYAGAGIGIAKVDWHGPVRRGAGEDLRYLGLGIVQTITNAYHSDDYTVALQGIVGASYDIPGVPGLALTGDFRFNVLPQGFAQHSLITLNFRSTPTPAAPVLVGSQAYSNWGAEFNYQFTVGLRYAFGGPSKSTSPVAPAAAAIAPAAVSRSYIVFFDWDKSALTDRAKQIIADAASASKKVAVTKIEVNGYTDTSGTPAYNKGLSVARANAVKAQLIADGVPAGEIVVVGYGDTHLLVPTAAGVREPQNRRVEIILK
jgi:outer membrane protein OmpA-like peptidoglycan-associated protein/opacity protein-like surface antigen